MNISVVLGLVPTKGIPLPLVSSGGSSMLVNLVGIGVLLNISQHAARWRREPRDGCVSLIAGGGTGGHLYPGIARGARAAAARPVHAGDVRRHGAGASKRGWCRARVSARPDSQRRLEGQVAALERPSGSRCCRSRRSTRGGCCRERRPDVVVGVGGYSSGPVLLLAALRGMPTLLLEQNALPGSPTGCWRASCARRR